MSCPFCSLAVIPDYTPVREESEMTCPGDRKEGSQNSVADSLGSTGRLHETLITLEHTGYPGLVLAQP